MPNQETTYEPTEFEIAWHYGHMSYSAFAAAFPHKAMAEREAQELREQEAAAFQESVRLWARTDEATPFIETAYDNSFPFPKWYEEGRDDTQLWSSEGPTDHELLPTERSQ
jgi:hypothetical protein